MIASVQLGYITLSKNHTWEAMQKNKSNFNSNLAAVCCYFQERSQRGNPNHYIHSSVVTFV